MASTNMSNIFGNELMKAAKVIENEVDREIEKYNELSDMTQEKFASEVEALRNKRLAALKKEAELKKTYLAKGHGNYDELSNEKEFFETTKNSDKVVVHFCEGGNLKCKIIDSLLKTLASKHIETKIVKIEVQRCPFLKERFMLKSIPTLVVVNGNILTGRITNFDDIVNIEVHSYKLLEWKLAKQSAINYEDDLTHPPESNKPLNPKTVKTIRGSAYDDLSDSD